jgi:hypothetical protein
MARKNVTSVGYWRSGENRVPLENNNIAAGTNTRTVPGKMMIAFIKPQVMLFFLNSVSMFTNA